MDTQLDYGNWIRKKNLLILGLIAGCTGILTAIPLGPIYRLFMATLFSIIGLCFLFPAYAYFMFSQKGGRFQDKVYQLILDCLHAQPKTYALDIGSGNGVLAVKFAQKYREAQVIGIDYWGQNWEYSQRVCEKNAQIAGAADRVRFQKGDAAALPFANNTFDVAISNLTFHEVQSVADKKVVLQEALRVVKPGGAFAFVDYFYDEQYYGKPSALKEQLTSLQLAKFECRPIREMIEVPLPLQHPRAFGKVGIIYGRK